MENLFVNLRTLQPHTNLFFSSLIRSYLPIKSANPDLLNYSEQKYLPGFFFFQILALCLVLLATPELAMGQSKKHSGAYPPTSNIPQKVFINAAKQVRIPPDSKFFKLIKEQVIRGHQQEWRLMKEKDQPNSKAIEESYQPPEIQELTQTEVEMQSSPLLVTKHIRGKQGVPFTEREKFMRVIRPAIKNTITEVEKGILTAAKSTRGKAAFKTPQLPGCKVSKTITTNTSKNHTRDWDQPVFDMLFISSELSPRDPDEYFGQATVLRPYKANSDDYQSMAAIGMGVNCLPVRIRGLRGVRYRQEGLAALKNYDANPAGEGTLHPVIQAQLKRYIKE